ncbi:hypothetical protein I5L21_01495 [Serratia liquefaciens]|uniref:hypothetical protein n=1 Tax=Serratia liquefaciens TaxID=614 RepID=UPI0018D5EACC|nr:hypothetical protein [Serratia liquefaciens]MBH2809252.1 hypothetical protein [Serratia liquefaciens]
MSEHETVLESLRQEEEFADEHQRTFGGADEDVVYIGDKPKKTINYMGRSFTLYMLAPTPVPAAVADYLLGFKGLFSTVGEMNREITLSRQAKQHHELTTESQSLAEQLYEQQQEELRRTTVRIGNDEIDLAKLTSVQMRDVAEDNGINLHFLPSAPAEMRTYLINYFKKLEITA